MISLWISSWRCSNPSQEAPTKSLLISPKDPNLASTGPIMVATWVPQYFLSDPGPIIVYASHSLTHTLTSFLIVNDLTLADGIKHIVVSWCCRIGRICKICKICRLVKAVNAWVRSAFDSDIIFLESHLLIIIIIIIIIIIYLQWYYWYSGPMRSKKVAPGAGSVEGGDGYEGSWRN